MSETDAVKAVWNQVGDRYYQAVIQYEERKIVHDYYLCKFRVVEVDTLFENGKPVAVFRSLMPPSSLPEYQSEDGLVDWLKEYSTDGKRLQITEEFDASVEAFRAAEQS